MDFRNFVSAEIQKDGYVFTFFMPLGCTYKSAYEASLEIAKSIEEWAKRAQEEQEKKAAAEETITKE